MRARKIIRPASSSSLLLTRFLRSLSFSLSEMKIKLLKTLADGREMAYAVYVVDCEPCPLARGRDADRKGRAGAGNSARAPGWLARQRELENVVEYEVTDAKSLMLVDLGAVADDIGAESVNGVVNGLKSEVAALPIKNSVLVKQIGDDLGLRVKWYGTISEGGCSRTAVAAAAKREMAPRENGRRCSKANADVVVIDDDGEDDGDAAPVASDDMALDSPSPL